MVRKFGLLAGSRRNFVLAAFAFELLAASSPIQAQEPGGEVVILNWLSGGEARVWSELEAAFTKAHPGITIRDLKITNPGDARGNIRTALLGGEVVDVIISTWPAFRAELAQAGVLRSIDEQWQRLGWDQRLAQTWRDMGSTDGVTYGMTYTYGDRSGIWYKPAQLAKAGLSAPPATWQDLLRSFAALKTAGFTVPVAIPGKVWAHTEWFETLLVRTAGVETAQKLVAHQIPWTDPAVKGALMKFAEMLNAGCCGGAPAMLANEWDGAADQLFKADASSYLLMGMWMNGRAIADYKLKDGVDYSLFQFPALGLSHDDTSIVDAKEVLVAANGKNPEAADVFLGFLSSKEAADIIERSGKASPSKLADPSLLGPVQKVATAAVADSKVHFVLGDLLPGDLVEEYRVQLQKFLQDPSEANIDKVLAAIEAKAAAVY